MKDLHLICSFFPPSFPLCFSVADTKRKVEQISEELKTLDEMLASNDGADGSVDTSDAEGTSPAPHDDSEQIDGKGAFFYRQNQILLFLIDSHVQWYHVM